MIGDTTDLDSCPQLTTHVINGNNVKPPKVLTNKQITKVMEEYNLACEITPVSMTHCIEVATKIDPEEVKKRLQGRAFLTSILYNNLSGFDRRR